MPDASCTGASASSASLSWPSIHENHQNNHNRSRAQHGTSLSRRIAASPAIRAKLDALLNLTLQRAFFETRSLEEVMDELSHNAQARGLTPQILAEILDEESAS